MLVNMFSPIFVPNFNSLTSLNESRNAKIDRLVDRSIMRMCNEAEQP